MPDTPRTYSAVQALLANNNSRAITAQSLRDSFASVASAIAHGGFDGDVVNLKVSYGAVGDGSTNDTAAIQAAHDALSDGDTLLVPTGIYSINQVNWTKRIHIVTLGSPEQVGFKARSGASGPLLNFAFASLKHHLRLENFYVDLTLAPTIVGLYLNNLDFAQLSNIKVRFGSVGYDIDSVAASDFVNCLAFNQGTSGFRVKHAAALDNVFSRCKVYMTSGATANMTVGGWDIQNGASTYMIGCRVQRTPGISFYMPYGMKVDSPATTDWLFLTNCIFDGVTDGTGANSATSAALGLVNTNSVFVVNSFFSANESAGQKQRGIMLDGCSAVSIMGGRVSGTGIGFAGTCSNINIAGADFPAAFSDAALNFGSATVTGLTYNGLNLSAALADDNVKLSAALGNTKTIGGRRFIVSDAAAAEQIILEHASTGKKKGIRVNNGSTGTLEFLGDNGTTKLFQITDAQSVIVGGGGNTIQCGTGTPEGAKTATVGSLFIRTDGGASTVLYVKESGAGNTGWVAK
jgi:hypothetical protein